MSFSAKPEIVTPTSGCQEITRSVLSAGQPIGVDIEGVRLGPKGPLTLLQMVTSTGQNYIFDVLQNKDLICKGGIKEVMESQSTVKVIHGCSSDSGALYHQFGVKLNNVFDTCMAQLVIDQNNGEKMPFRMKLEDLVAKYGGNIAQSKSWDQWKYEPDIWAKRPLTQQMIDYAINDVIMLFPDVYIKLKREVDQNNLWEQLQERVDESINEFIEREKVREQKKERKKKLVQEELEELEDKFAGLQISEAVFQTLPESSTRALWDTLRKDEMEIGPNTKRLRQVLFQNFLSDCEQDLRTNPRDFVNKKMSHWLEEKLQDIQAKCDPELSERASLILHQVDVNRLQKAFWIIDRGFTLGSAEKFLLFRENEKLFKMQDARQLERARKAVVKGLEKEMDEGLRETPPRKPSKVQKALLKLIPEEYLSEGISSKYKNKEASGDTQKKVTSKKKKAK